MPSIVLPALPSTADTAELVRIVNLMGAYLNANAIPTSLPPSGAAGGVLSGSYPNPSLAAGVINTGNYGAGTVDTAALANGNVTAAKLASGAALANLAASSITEVVYNQAYTADYWSNTALSAGDNGFSGLPAAMTFHGGYGIAYLQASVQLDGPTLVGNAVFGWDLNVNNALHTRLSRLSVVTGVNTYVSCNAAVYLPGPLSGSVQIGPWFWCSQAIANKAYLRCSGNAQVEFMRLTVIEVNR